VVKKKHPLKSKTILFGLVTIIVAVFNMFSPQTELTSEMTWKQLEERQGQQTNQITDLLVLLGGSGAIYGRITAKTEIGGKNE